MTVPDPPAVGGRDTATHSGWVQGGTSLPNPEIQNIEKPHCLWVGLIPGIKSDSEVSAYFCQAVRFEVKASWDRVMDVLPALVMAGPGMGAWWEFWLARAGNKTEG